MLILTVIVLFVQSNWTLIIWIVSKGPYFPNYVISNILRKILYWRCFFQMNNIKINYIGWSNSVTESPTYLVGVVLDVSGTWILQKSRYVSTQVIQLIVFAFLTRRCLLRIYASLKSTAYTWIPTCCLAVKCKRSQCTRGMRWVNERAEESLRSVEPQTICDLNISLFGVEGPQPQRMV